VRISKNNSSVGTKMNFFIDHELIFLGTGGGRVHSSTQHRKTGGIIYVFNSKQVHIDPGPGAIVYLNKMKIDRFKTKWVIVTHNHTDHQNDVPIIVESMHKSLSIPIGTLISTQDYILSLNVYYRNLLTEIIPFMAGKSVQLDTHTLLQATKVDHGSTEGFGLIFYQQDPAGLSKSYQIGFTSDTEIYNEFGETYKNLDILVANVLRPSNKVCRHHACVDELIPALKDAKPKVCVLTHFGALFDSPDSTEDLIGDQVKYMQKSIGGATKIIAAEDGMHLYLKDLMNV